MAEIVLIGLNHKTAPVALRECIAFSPEQTADALDGLHLRPEISEVIIISTCNRVEVLMVTDAGDAGIPMVTSAVAIWAIASYTITEEKAHEVRRDLEARRGAV